jgi:NTE family protein
LSPEGICLVLGAGGFRGVAHAGVLLALRRAGVRIDSLVGTSIGGLVAASYAALGVAPEEIAARISRLTTAALFAMGWALRGRGRALPGAAARASPFLEGLARLRNASFDRLHYGVRRLGLLAMSLPTFEEVFAATGGDRGIPLHAIAIGGASIPGLFPSVRARTGGRVLRLVDGGLSRSVPVEYALDPPFEAARILAVDLRVIRGFRERDPRRWARLEERFPGPLVRIRPRVEQTGTVFFRPGTGEELVRAGEESVTPEVLARLGLTRFATRC